MSISQACLDRFQQNKMDFKRRFITVDETWIHHYTPERKEQSKQWIKTGRSAPKKAKRVPSAGKVMATVFLGLQKLFYFLLIFFSLKVFFVLNSYLYYFFGKNRKSPSSGFVL